MSLKDAMEQAWRMRGVASPVLKARWKRKYDPDQKALRLEPTAQTSLLEQITIARTLGRRRPR